MAPFAQVDRGQSLDGEGIRASRTSRNGLFFSEFVATSTPPQDFIAFCSHPDEAQYALYVDYTLLCVYRERPVAKRLLEKQLFKLEANKSTDGKN